MNRLITLVLLSGAIVNAGCAEARRIYLVGIEFGQIPGKTTIVIPMDSMEQCEAAGMKLQASVESGRLKPVSHRLGYECIVGQ